MNRNRNQRRAAKMAQNLGVPYEVALSSILSFPVGMPTVEELEMHCSDAEQFPGTPLPYTGTDEELGTENSKPLPLIGFGYPNVDEPETDETPTSDSLWELMVNRIVGTTQPTA